MIFECTFHHNQQGFFLIVHYFFVNLKKKTPTVLYKTYAIYYLEAPPPDDVVALDVVLYAGEGDGAPHRHALVAHLAHQHTLATFLS